jgi:hypothetical protein
MKILANLLFIGGFCLATVGGAGFSDPIEQHAMMMFVAGLVMCLVGGIVIRRMTHAEAHEKAAEGLSEPALAAAIADLHRRTRQLAEDADGLDAKALCARIDELLQGPFFDIGSRNEDYMRVLGNAVYTRYWDGFAVGERLIARAWSMAADGALEEARAELPGVVANLQRAEGHEVMERGKKQGIV